MKAIHNNSGYATYIDKEKALNYLYLSAPIAEAASNSGLSSATKIVEDFENPTLPEDEDNTSFRRRGMTVPVQGENESDFDFTRRCIDRISYTYEPVVYSDISPDSESDIYGWYESDKGRITIFAKQGNDFFENEDTYFHENLHAFIDKEYDGAEGEIKEFYENTKLNYPRNFNKCLQALRHMGYTEDQFPEELFVFF